MPAMITIIGWHNSGKTTLVSQVVRQLSRQGYRVAVIKSTKEVGIVFDPPHTDTARHRQAGAATVMLVAPDQITLRTDNRNTPFRELAARYCADADIVIGEGFKNAEGVAKIEVRREEDQPLLRDQVSGVIALVSDLEIADTPGCARFRLDQIKELSAFIEITLRLTLSGRV